MEVNVQQVAQLLQQLAPLSLQESYDNAGLITGSPLMKVRGILCSLDCTEAVIAEAVKQGCNMVVCHHPIIFSGLKTLTGANYVQRTIIAAIKADVAIYAAHTNLDNVTGGVNTMLAEKLQLQDISVLQPMAGQLLKLVTFAPHAWAAEVREALFAAGAGNISNYSHCSYNLKGEGTYLPGEGSNPVAGEVGEMHTEPETRIEVILFRHQLNNVLAALRAAHKYEEIAYDIYPLDNATKYLGAGMLGNLAMPMAAADFLQHVKNKLGLTAFKYTVTSGQPVQKVAVCGGSGAFLIQKAMQAGAHAYITADVKYHEYFNAEGELLIVDIGHYESEIHTAELLQAYLAKHLRQPPVHVSKVNTNPVKYFS